MESSPIHTPHHTCACHMATMFHRGLTSPQMTCLPADPNMTLKIIMRCQRHSG